MLYLSLYFSGVTGGDAGQKAAGAGQLRRFGMCAFGGSGRTADPSYMSLRLWMNVLQSISNVYARIGRSGWPGDTCVD
jgi:hypothetical protein